MEVLRKSEVIDTHDSRKLSIGVGIRFGEQNSESLMIKAKQEQVIQQTNAGTVDLRIQELRFYCNFYLNFGAQGTLVLCYVLGTITQVPLEGPEHHPVFSNMYALTTAVCVAFAAHVMFVSLYTYVYGYQLALRGIRGSVLRAIDGLSTERTSVFRAYSLMVVFFVFVNCGAFWSLMNKKNAMICSFIALGGGILWFRYCMKVYNEFKLGDNTGYFRPVKMGFSMHHSNDMRSGDKKDELTQAEKEREKKFLDTVTSANRYLNSKRNAFLRNFIYRGRKKQTEDTKKNSDDQSKFLKRRWSDHDRTASRVEDLINSGVRIEPSTKTTEIDKGVRHSGYLTLRNASMNEKRHNSWRRRFLLLRGNELWFYQSEIAYEKNPDVTVRSRPLDVTLYKVAGFTEQPPFKLTLCHIDPNFDGGNTWELKCDSMYEMYGWSRCFQDT